MQKGFSTFQQPVIFSALVSLSSICSKPFNTWTWSPGLGPGPRRSRFCRCDVTSGVERRKTCFSKQMQMFSRIQDVVYKYRLKLKCLSCRVCCCPDRRLRAFRLSKQLDFGRRSTTNRSPSVLHVCVWRIYWWLCEEQTHFMCLRLFGKPLPLKSPSAEIICINCTVLHDLPKQATFLNQHPGKASWFSLDF